MALYGAIVIALAALLSASTSAQLLQGAAPGAVIAPGAAAATNPCALGINFFPPGSDNRPTGWTQAVQQAAGNTASDQLVKIALAGYPIPQLYMAPSSVFTQVNGQIPAQCMGAAAPGVLVKPAEFIITWALAGVGVGGQLGPYTKGSKQDPPANVTLNVVPQLRDGDYCLQLKMDILPGTGDAVVGAQTVRVPSAPLSISRQVCFMKIATRPSADVAFHSCNDSFAVNLLNISPKPAFANPSLQLFSTVFHVWGKLNRTFDPSPQSDNLLDYFDQYVKWEDPTKPPFLQVYMDSPGLINGYYNVWIEGSLATSYPELVSLFGLDQYDDGSAKYMGVSLRNSSNTPIPIQTTPSKIADLAGPDIPVPVGQMATFTWDTQGYGEQFCYVDGKAFTNHPDAIHCQSPLEVPVPADNVNHTLVIRLLDVCRQYVENGVYFGRTGWQPNRAYIPPPPPPAPPQPEYNDPGMPMATMRPSRPLGNRTSGAAATVASNFATLAAGMLGALLAL